MYKVRDLKTRDLKERELQTYKNAMDGCDAYVAGRKKNFEKHLKRYKEWKKETGVPGIMFPEVDEEMKPEVVTVE